MASDKRKPAGPGEVASMPSETPAVHEAVNAAHGAKVQAIAAAARNPRWKQGMSPSDIQRLVRRLQNDEPWDRVKRTTLDIDPDVLELWRPELEKRAANPQGERRMPRE